MDVKCRRCDKAHSTGYFCGYVGVECDEFPGVDFINPRHPFHDGGCDKFIPEGTVSAVNLIGKEIWYMSRYDGSYRKDDVPCRKCVQYVSVLKDGTVLLHTKVGAFPISSLGECIFRSKDELMFHEQEVKNSDC